MQQPSRNNGSFFPSRPPFARERGSTFFLPSPPQESSVLQEQLSKSRPLDSKDLKLIEQDLSQQLHSGLGAAAMRLEGMETCVGLENGGEGWACLCGRYPHGIYQHIKQGVVVSTSASILKLPLPFRNVLLHGSHDEQHGVRALRQRALRHRPELLHPQRLQRLSAGSTLRARGKSPLPTQALGEGS